MNYNARLFRRDCDIEDMFFNIYHDELQAAYIVGFGAKTRHTSDQLAETHRLNPPIGSVYIYRIRVKLK